MITNIKDYKKILESSDITNYYEYAMDVFEDFNILTSLIEENYLTGDLNIKEGITMDEINEYLEETLDVIEYDLIKTIEKCKKVLNFYKNL